MRRVYRAVRAAQARAGPDRLRGPARAARSELFDDDARARPTFRERYRAFTVDEYQDVNLLQQTLLDLLARRPRRPLRRRRRLPVDLRLHRRDAGVPARRAGAVPARGRGPARGELPLDAAGARAREPARAELGGAEKRCAPSGRRAGAERALVRDAEAEAAFVVERIRALRTCPLEEIAILCRTNARLADFEEALHEAGIPFQGASLLDARGGAPAAAAARDVGAGRRSGARRSRSSAAGSSSRPTSSASGSRRGRPTSRGSSGWPRSSAARGADFAAELERRFGDGGDARRGVHLLTYHRAKGLEFEAVFLPRLEEKELPSRQARTPAEIAEERRLLYVGMTRAKRQLWRSRGRQAEPLPRRARARGAGAAGRGRAGRSGVEALKALAARARAGRTRCPPYVVFHDTTLEEIAARGRGASPSWRRSRASARRSSSATARRCWGVGAQRGEQQVEQHVRVAADAASRSRPAALRRSRARGPLERREPAVADQLLVDAAEPPAEGRVDRHAERDGLAVHRPAGGDDEVRERDQALRVDGAVGDDQRGQRRAPRT